jgi:hypothetical protein
VCPNDSLNLRAASLANRYLSLGLTNTGKILGGNALALSRRVVSLYRRMKLAGLPVAAHLIEAMASHQPSQEQHPREVRPALS